MDNKVYKYYEYEATVEALYKADENGEMKIQDYEFYLDHYPNKYRYSDSEKSEELYKDYTNGIWVLKYKNNFIGTISDSVNIDKIKSILEIIKK